MSNFDLNTWVNILQDGPDSFRSGMRAVSVGGYIYLTGTNVAEVLRSQDCITWEVLTSSPGWARRCHHGFLFFDNKFWIFGGQDRETAGFLCDVWSSEDAITWDLVTSNAGWGLDDGRYPERSRFGFCVHGGAIYMSGGQYSTTDLSIKSDMFRTTDGITWTRIVPDNNNIKISRHVMCSFLGDIYIYGGRFYFFNSENPAQSYYSDCNRIYKSSDGVTWERLTDAPWATRQDHQYLVNDNENGLAIMFGLSSQQPSGSKSDIWKTTDGVNFTEVLPINSDPYNWFFVIPYINVVTGLGSNTYIVGSLTLSALGVPQFTGAVWANLLQYDADFSADRTIVHIGETVEFTDLSQGTYLFAMWNFGYTLQGVITYTMTAQGQNPSHRFSMVGTFAVSMTITDSNGNTDREEKLAYITVLPYQLSFSGTPRDGRAPLRVAFNAELVE